MLDKQRDAILAGLRLLQWSLDEGSVSPDDGDIGDILTCGGTHAGMTAAEIDQFCEQFNFSPLNFLNPIVNQE